MLVKGALLFVFALLSVVVAQRTDYPVLAMWINQQGSRVGSLDPFDGTYYFNHSQLLTGYSPKPSCFYNPASDLFHFIESYNGVSILMTSFVDGSSLHEYPVNITEQIHSIQFDSNLNKNYGIVIYSSQQMGLYTYVLVGGGIYWTKIVDIPATYRPYASLSTYCPKGHVYFVVGIDRASIPWLLRINTQTKAIQTTQLPFFPTSLAWDYNTATLYVIASYVDADKNEVSGVVTMDVDTGKLLTTIVNFPGDPYPSQTSAYDAVSRSLYLYFTTSTQPAKYFTATVYVGTGNSEYNPLVNQGTATNPWVPVCMAILENEF